MTLRISTVNHSDSNGGAARAAYRLHRALLGEGMQSRMLVNDARTGDWTVEGPQTIQGRMLARLRIPAGALLSRVLKTRNSIRHSPAALPSHWGARFNQSDADVVHLHWVNHEMMSIKDIGHIRKPLVWTLHDMWAFCGAEHLTDDFRWRDGYSRENRPDYESGFDLNRWVWQRKRRAWQHPIHVVTPSHWLARCVRDSALMSRWPVSVIHNPIDTETWRPFDKKKARELAGIASDGPLLLFGTFRENSAPHKGFDLLYEALQRLRGRIDGLQLVVLGEREPQVPKDFGFPVHYTGHLHDDLSLRALYSAADVTLIPSRQENLPNMGVESLACGTPVVAFEAGGLPDVVHHMKTGYLAKAYDTAELAEGVAWVLEHGEKYASICENAREDAVARFSYPVVASQYLDVYQAAITSRHP